MFETLRWELGAHMSGLFGGASSPSTTNVTLSQAIEALDEMNLMSRYTPTFRRLVSSKEDVEKFSRILIRTKRAGIELTRDKIPDIEKATGFDSSDIEEAMMIWLLAIFLIGEKNLSLPDLEIVHAVQEALYNKGQKNDLDDVSTKTGIPLDIVQNIDAMMEEFLTQWNSNPQVPITGGNPKKKPPKTKPITVDDPNGSQGSLNP